MKNKAIFWDYNLAKINLHNPKAKLWYLNRKLKFGDLSGLKKSDLKRYLSKLDISPAFKKLLANYLKKK